MASSGAKRGAIAKRLDLLAKLQPLLRAPVAPERILRSVASLLAVEIGQYCIADFVGKDGTLKRLEIEHADPSRRARLLVACEDASLGPDSRVARVIAAGGRELVARVSDAVRGRALADVQLLDGERVRSYMAAAVPVNGAAMALLTLVVAHGARRYDDDDAAFLGAVADWVGLGLENALRREAQPRASTPPRGRASSLPANPMGGEESPTAVRRANPLRERTGR